MAPEPKPTLCHPDRKHEANGYCKPCARKADHLRREYGVTLDEWYGLVKAQGGRCAICLVEADEFDFDHCHLTKRLRGLICKTCNRGLGQFKDSPVALERAAAYLREQGDLPAPGAVLKRLYLELTSGVNLDLRYPRPEDIRLDDIALGLSNQCRWAGHCPIFYSIAEHACLVHDLVAHRAAQGNWIPELARVCKLAALHHDDHEAYTTDLPTPLKTLVGAAYTDVADRLDDAIGDGLGLGWARSHFEDPEVKWADALALHLEAERFKPSRGRGWEGRPDVVELPAGVEWACGLSPAQARQAYLDRHALLTRP